MIDFWALSSGAVFVFLAVGVEDSWQKGVFALAAAMAFGFFFRALTSELVEEMRRRK